MSRALVVEDKEEGLYYLRALLEGRGWTVASAHNGAEALEKARQTPPDLAISDLLMPIMDGYTLLRHWKADARLKQVPFIVYTATYTDPADERLALGLGADAFILKPSEPDDFLSRVAAVQAKAASSIPPLAPSEDESTTLKLHRDALVRKLEKKMRDVEEANRTLQQEKRELELRDRAIQAVSQGIVITDPHLPDHPIVYVNPGFTQITGYSAKETLGRNCRFLQGRETDTESAGEIAKAIRERRGCTVELLNYKKDHTPFWNLVTISPVVDGTGALTHFVGVQVDVTEQRQLEARLRQAQKMEAVGQLAAGIAHDFNNLLSVILSYATLALDQLTPGAPLRTDIEEIRRAGERATEVTRHLLAFSRQQVLQPRVVDLGQLMVGMENMLRRVLGEHVELSLLAAPPPGKVNADPSQIEQIVLNLVLNARDAMPKGGTLTIEVSNVDLDPARAADRAVAPGRYVVLAVTDTGAGMDAATRERIFEPFFTTKEKGKGTGLGLSTVFGIVRQSQGQIEVLSEAEHGTTFKVYLPRVDPVPETRTLAPPEQASLGGSETILLVEDDERVRLVTCAILRRHGYSVLDAQNAGEAFLICEQFASRIDLLLSDLVMPRMTGKQLADRLVAMRPEMKVLFMSGYVQDHAGKADTAGASVVLVEKPFTPGVLLSKIRETLDAGRQAKRAQALRAEEPMHENGRPPQPGTR